MSRSICGVCMCPYGDAGDCACEAKVNECGFGAGCCYQASRIETLEALNQELVEALKQLLKDSERVKEVMLQECGIGMVDEVGMAKARAAIAKANGSATQTGETE